MLRAARRAEAIEFGLYRRIAKLWAVVDAEMERARFQPVASSQSLSDDFRRRRRLERRADTLAWRLENNLDHQGYVELALRDARLEWLLGAPQRYLAGMLRPSAPACWLLDAIRLTGLYGRLAGRLNRRAVTDSRSVRPRG